MFEQKLLFALKPLVLAIGAVSMSFSALAQESLTEKEISEEQGSLTENRESKKEEDIEEDIETVYVIAERVVVRNHVDETSPKLIYDAAYFQRFEPISVGDALKRVPGITFNSDVGEYDLPRLRGLDSRYTQILINGKEIPGSANDGAIAVDRIPAEIIEDIEIIRSPSSDISSEGVGGTINIVLKDGSAYQGGFWRLGAVDTGQTRGSGFVGVSGSSGQLDYGFSFNAQERYNPKLKTQVTFEDNEREDQIEDDIRDSTDLSFNGDLTYNLTNGDKANLNIYYIDTDREETERTQISLFEQEDDTSDFELTERALETQLEEIDQKNVALSTNYYLYGDVVTSEFYASYHEFEEDKTETNSEADFGEALEIDDLELTDINDSQWRVGVKSSVENDTIETRFGIELERQERDFNLTVIDGEGEVDDENDEFSDFSAEQDSIDAFALIKWQLSNTLEVETGLRAEYTDLDIRGNDFNGDQTDSNESDIQLNPNAHLRWHLTDDDQFRVSLAKTVRRPQFDQLNPVSLTIEDEIFQGDTDLDPEVSWGLDVGYEHFIQDHTVIGINAFYRRVSDLIEFTEIETVIDGEEFDLRTPINNDNDGTIYGVEFDVSAPATFIGLPNLQWNINYTYLDSEVEDSFFEGLDRQFSGQGDYVFNVGFEHELNSLAMSYGLTYQQQGDVEEFEGEEINRISYDGNLELFIEKRFDNDNYVLRLSGQNLLDSDKEEFIREFDGIDALRDGTPDTLETEVESSEPSIVLTLRGRF